MSEWGDPACHPSESYLTIPPRWRAGFHPTRPERDGFTPERWSLFGARLDILRGLDEVADQIDLERGFQMRHDADRFFVDLDGRRQSFAMDRINAYPWPFEAYQLTPLIGTLQLIIRLTLPGVCLTSKPEWDGPEWSDARALYAKAFGQILRKSPLTIYPKAQS